MTERSNLLDITREMDRLMRDYEAGKVPHEQFSEELAILRLLNEKVRLRAEALEVAQFYEKGRITHLITGCLLGSDPTCDKASIETHFKAIEDEKDFDLWMPFLKAISTDELKTLYAEPEKSKAALESEVQAAEANLKELKDRLRKRSDLEGKESFEMHQTHPTREPS